MEHVVVQSNGKPPPPLFFKGKKREKKGECFFLSWVFRSCKSLVMEELSELVTDGGANTCTKIMNMAFQVQQLLFWKENHISYNSTYYMMGNIS